MIPKLFTCFDFGTEREGSLTLLTSRISKQACGPANQRHHTWSCGHGEIDSVLPGWVGVSDGGEG